MLRNGKLSLGFPAPHFLTLYDEIGTIAIFHRDDSKTSRFSIKLASLKITIFFNANCGGDEK